jgi:hypothetical protein
MSVSRPFVSRVQILKNKAKLLQKAKSKAGKPILLKDALEIVAKSAHFSSWRELKENLEANEPLWRPMSSAFWNVWYASYEEALKHLTPGHYLLPYQKQFFICDFNYIKSFNLQEDDADLKRVGNNWVEPKDPQAWDRLWTKIKAGR